MIHIYTLFGDHIAYDSHVGALYKMSAAAAAGLSERMANEHSLAYAAALKQEHMFGGAEAAEAAAEIDELIAGGGLLLSDHGDQASTPGAPDVFGPNASTPGDPDAFGPTEVVKSLCIHLAHDCNMHCAYCFASQGSFSGERGLMSYETARAAIDFVTAASAGRTNIEIDFFGGEPLLNFDVLRRVVDYARGAGRRAGKRFRFTLTTNGILLNDDVIAYVNQNMDNLVLSLDGRREVNDRMRKRLDGSGSYDDISEKFTSVVKDREASWYVRGTFTALNKDFAADVLHLADRGFDHISIEPVVSSADRTLEFAPGDEAEISAEYEKLAYALYERSRQGRPIDFFHFNVDPGGGPCYARQIKGCGAGAEYAAVAPDGGLYPCHQFAGSEAFRLGDVFGGITNRDAVEAFKRRNIYENGACRACWAKFLCGGGCAANAWHYNRDINKPNGFYCNIFRKRMECALWLKCALLNAGTS